MITIISIIMVFSGVLGLIGIYFRISMDIQRDLLKKMFYNNDIDQNTYKKYLP